jgi:hypothetical protein
VVQVALELLIQVRDSLVEAVGLELLALETLPLKLVPLLGLLAVLEVLEAEVAVEALPLQTRLLRVLQAVRVV